MTGLGGLLLGIAALISCLTTLVSTVVVRRKVEDVHSLVNSQHDEILDTVASLETQLATAKTQPPE